MTIVVWGVKCAHKHGDGVRLLQVWNSKEQIATLELFNHSSCNSCMAADCDTGVIRSCVD